jgi:hypothetical protein
MNEPVVPPDSIEGVLDQMNVKIQSRLDNAKSLISEDIGWAIQCIKTLLNNGTG